MSANQREGFYPAYGIVVVKHHENEERAKTMKKRLVMIGATAFAVSLLSPAMLNAAVSPLQVSVSGDEVSVSVVENALDDTSKLYLVWDDADHGESLENWPAENRIAYSGDTAISSAAATYKFNKAGVPENVYLRVIATSDVRLIDGYVKLGANQYVNTGVKDTSAYGLEIRYRPTGTASTSWSSLMGGVHDKFTIGINNSNYNKYYIRYAAGTEVGNPAYTLPDTTGPHSVRIFSRVFSLMVNLRQHQSRFRVAPSAVLVFRFFSA